MRRYTLSFADFLMHVPKHPERTGFRQTMGADIMFAEWPNRPAMLKSIQMQKNRAPRQDDWKDWQTWSERRKADGGVK